MTQEAGTPPGFWEQIDRKIDAKVAKAMRSGPLRNATISSGGLTVKGGFLKVLFPEDQGGGLGVYFGDIVGESTGAYLGTGLLIQDDNGTDMARFRTDVATGTTRVDLCDGAGRIIVGNDAVSGQGMARPHIFGGFSRARFSDWSVSTTSGTFETLWRQWVIKQHPRLEVGVRASMDTAATAGELRVMVDGVQLGSTTAEDFSLSTRYFGPAPIAGGHMAAVLVEIQGRVTSGSGALRVEPMYWRGIQS